MIFSDNYTVHERYSLISGERLADYSEMPWLYTPLVDDRYHPSTIPVSVKNQLNRIFEYKQPVFDVEAIKEEEKLLGIYHNGDDIVSYRSRGRVRYSAWRAWRGDYVIKTASSTTRDLYEKMDEIVSATPKGNTAFLGHDLDASGYIVGCTVVDRKYNLESYNNPLLEKVSWYSENAHNFCKGVINIRRDDEVSYYSKFTYPKTIATIKKEEFRKNPNAVFKKENYHKVSYRQSLARHMAGYRTYGILTEEQYQNAFSLLQDDTVDAQLQIEHVFKGSELVDIIAHVIQYFQFEKIQVPTTFRYNRDEQGNRIW